MRNLENILQKYKRNPEIFNQMYTILLTKGKNDYTVADIKILIHKLNYLNNFFESKECYFNIMNEEDLNDFVILRGIIIDIAQKIEKCPTFKQHRLEKELLNNENSKYKKQLDKLKRLNEFISKEIMAPLGLFKESFDALQNYLETKRSVETYNILLEACNGQIVNLEKICEELGKGYLAKDFKGKLDLILKSQLQIKNNIESTIAALTDDQIKNQSEQLLNLNKELIRMVERANNLTDELIVCITTEIKTLDSEIVTRNVRNNAEINRILTDFDKIFKAYHNDKAEESSVREFIRKLFHILQMILKRIIFWNTGPLNEGDSDMRNQKSVDSGNASGDALENQINVN